MKELKIEMKLTDIEGVWSVMELSYSAHKDTEMFVPHPSEEVVEIMEAHQMELQGSYGSASSWNTLKNVSCSDRAICEQLTIHSECGLQFLAHRHH